MRTAPSTTRSVMLIDDRDLFRAGLKTLLEDSGIRVVAQCGPDGAPVHLAQGSRPDVILVDILSVGADLVGRLVEEVPGAAVIVLTTSTAAADVIAALRAGARGYVAKSTPVEQLAEHVQSVAEGGYALSDELLGELFSFVRTGTIPGVSPGGHLSARELDVLHFVAKGLDNNQIAHELAISAKTVKNHLASIFTKLEVANRVQAAVYAVRSGLG